MENLEKGTIKIASSSLLWVFLFLILFCFLISFLSGDFSKDKVPDKYSSSNKSYPKKVVPDNRWLELIPEVSVPMYTPVDRARMLSGEKNVKPLYRN